MNKQTNKQTTFYQELDTQTCFHTNILLKRNYICSYLHFIPSPPSLHQSPLSSFPLSSPGSEISEGPINLVLQNTFQIIQNTPISQTLRRTIGIDEATEAGIKKEQ